MTRGDRARLLRERHRALNPLSRLVPRGPVAPKKAASVKGVVTHFPWPHIDVNHGERAPDWFKVAATQPGKPALRTKLGRNESPLTTAARILTDPAQLQAICLDRKVSPGKV